MATTRHPNHFEPAEGSQTVAAGAPGRAKPRLRNSCHACSVSKLKCPQEKPTCSRCAKRSLKCEYFVAKPGGRKPSRTSGAGQARRRPIEGATETHHEIEADPFAKDANAVPAHLPLHHDAWFHVPASADPQSTGGNPLHSPDVLVPHQLHSPRPAGMTMDPDMPLSIGHRVSSSSASSTLNGQMNLGDCFSTPLSFTTERTDFDFLGAAANLFATEDSCDVTNKSCTRCDNISHKDTSSLHFNTEFTPFLDSSSISELFTVFTSSDTHDALLSSPSLELQNYTPPTPPPHSCFSRALRSLERMSSEPHLKNPGAPPTAAGMIAENEAVMEDVGSMLECSCSEDGYLLYIAALIISKALDCYSYVVRQGICPPRTEGPDRSPGCGTSLEIGSLSSNSGAGSILEDSAADRRSHSCEGLESARMTAQLVLSELYLVRRLVGKLSDKLKGQAAGDEVGCRAAGTGSANGGLVGKTASPCLFRMGNHFTEALSGQLKALSLDISHQLRAA